MPGNGQNEKECIEKRGERVTTLCVFHRFQFTFTYNTLCIAVAALLFARALFIAYFVGLCQCEPLNATTITQEMKSA